MIPCRAAICGLVLLSLSDNDCACRVAHPLTQSRMFHYCAKGRETSWRNRYMPKPLPGASMGLEPGCPNYDRDGHQERKPDIPDGVHRKDLPSGGLHPLRTKTRNQQRNPEPCASTSAS